MCDTGTREGQCETLKQVTKDMIREWDMKSVDWMGYKKRSDDIFTFHRLLIPNREGGPYAMQNGAILCGKTGHPYLHLIENVDYDTFTYLTSLLIDENALGRLDLEIIKEIDYTLKDFEKQYDRVRNSKKKRIIKPEYRIRDYSSLK